MLLPGSVSNILAREMFVEFNLFYEFVSFLIVTEVGLNILVNLPETPVSSRSTFTMGWFIVLLAFGSKATLESYLF